MYKRQEEHHHEYDPHLWLSPHRAMKMVESICDQLVAAYPDKKKTFEKNAQDVYKRQDGDIGLLEVKE